MFLRVCMYYYGGMVISITVRCSLFMVLLFVDIVPSHICIYVCI